MVKIRSLHPFLYNRPDLEYHQYSVDSLDVRLTPEELNNLQCVLLNFDKRLPIHDGHQPLYLDASRIVAVDARIFLVIVTKRYDVRKIAVAYGWVSEGRHDAGKRNE